MNTDTPETDSAYIQRPNEGAWDFRVRQEKTMEKLERERDEARDQRDKLAEALQKLADCDWVITLPDRMDAVRAIAQKALQSLTTNP